MSIYSEHEHIQTCSSNCMVLAVTDRQTDRQTLPYFSPHVNATPTYNTETTTHTLHLLTPF